MSKKTDIVYEYILWFKGKYDGLAPSLREICRACGVSSTSMAVYYLKRLERQGRIRLLGRGRSRGIIVVGGYWRVEQ